MRVVSPDEENRYLLSASQPLRDFATIMIDTGMRPEEVMRIERRNVVLSENYLVNPFGKTKAARRKIFLTERVRNIMEKRLLNKETDLMFCNEATGNPITTFKRSHATALRRSQLAHFRLYDLRHTFATRFIESGGDLLTLQAVLGHANIQMVVRYAHPTEKHQVEAIRNMEAKRKANEPLHLIKRA
jgi:integrase